MLLRLFTNLFVYLSVICSAVSDDSPEQGERPRLSLTSSVAVRVLLRLGYDLIDRLGEQNLLPDYSHDPLLSTLRTDMKTYMDIEDTWQGGIARHPLCSHRLISQLRQMRKTLVDEGTLPANMEMGVERLPNDEDYAGSIQSIIRLQETYLLRTDDIVRGMIAGEQSFKLTYEQIRDIADAVFRGGRVALAIEWIDAAIDAATDEKEKMKYEQIRDIADAVFRGGRVALAIEWIDAAIEAATDEKEKMKCMFNKAVSQFQNRQKDEAIDTLKTIYELGPESPQTNEQIRNYVRFFVNSQPAELPGKPEWQEKFEQICRADNGETETPTYSSTHVCRLTTNGHPWLLLQPLREETFCAEIRGVIYRDFLSSTDCDFMVRYSAHKLQPSRVGIGEIDGQKQEAPSKERTSMGYFMETEQLPALTRIRSRISAVSGHRIDNLEYLQVNNYGVGGHYSPHLDMFKEGTKNTGKNNRVATALLYLNNVERGGGTAFVRLGIKADPRKGDVVFWYNYHKNGTKNPATLHGACPVLLGTKWIANQWIRFSKYEYIHPSDL